MTYVPRVHTDFNLLASDALHVSARLCRTTDVATSGDDPTITVDAGVTS